MLVDRTYIVGSRPLQVDGTIRTPGQLVPEALDWLPKVRGIHLELGWLEEVKLLTDDERRAFQRQWDQERRARFEAAKLAAQEPKPEPVAEPERPPMLTLACANCRKKNTFKETPADRDWWQCSGCGQRQTGEQSHRGTLQIINIPGNHAPGHNHVESYWRGGDVA